LRADAVLIAVVEIRTVGDVAGVAEPARFASAQVFADAFSVAAAIVLG
jgi:hypothetical protein